MRITLALAILVYSASAQAQLGGRLSPPGETRALPPSPGETREVPAAPSTGTPPDLVLLRDGGMLRGTIVQSSPGREVVIRLETGETRGIAWSTVRFAGRSQDAPSVHVEGSGVAVSFRSGAQPLTLHERASRPGDAPSYTRLCAAPCEFRTEPGTHRFALSLFGNPVLEARPVSVMQAGTLSGTYVRHSGTRAGGWALLISGLVGFVGATIGAVAGAAISLGVTIPLGVFAGLDLLVGLAVGIPMVASGDGAVVRFD